MSQSIISVRVEEDIKQSFDSFCNSAGLNPSVAINMFIKATLRERRIPFDIRGSYEPYHSKANKTRLQKALTDVKKGKNMIYKTLEEFEALEND